MQRVVSIALIVLGLSASLGLAACAAPVAEQEVRWAREGASEADLEADREACLEVAAGTKGESKRFDHVAKGSALLGCMTERGWRQVAADSDLLPS